MKSSVLGVGIGVRLGRGGGVGRMRALRPEASRESRGFDSLNLREDQKTKSEENRKWTVLEFQMAGNNHHSF